jgi:microsomal dipeptidase-like Zn-dependent dipeptidase
MRTAISAAALLAGLAVHSCDAGETVPSETVSNGGAGGNSVDEGGSGGIAGAGGESPTDPVPGFADIHVHAFAELAYAGGWYWGRVVGPEPAAMASCSGGSLTGGDHARTKFGPLNEFLGQLPGTSGDTGWHFGKTQGFPGYDGWPRWDTIAHQQMWEGHLESAHERGLNLLVTSAVNFGPLCESMPEENRDSSRSCDDMEAVDLQIDAAWAFDEARDWVEIALSPTDARRIIAEGKLALVLAIEVTELFGAADPLVELDAYFARGVRSIQLAHQLDNRFTGVAPHHWIFKLFQILERDAGFELDDDGKNVKGLTDEGRALAEAMMDRGMIIDIAHVTEQGVRNLREVSAARGYYPLVLSHGHFRSIMLDEKQQEEKTTPDWVVEAIRETGGMVGLRTGAEQVKSYPASGVPNDCDGSSKSLAQAYAYGSVGLKVPIALASDFNGFIAQLRPRFGGDTETCGASGDDTRRASQQELQADPLGSPLDTQGFGHIGIEPDVIAELAALGLDVSGLGRSAESFIHVWERGLDPDRSGPLPTNDMSTIGIEP